MILTRASTDAEQQIASQFEAEAARLPGGNWVPAARADAMRAFAEVGLPHRRIEEWKYTDLRTSLRTAYPRATCAAGALDSDRMAAALGPELAALACIRLVLVNGRYVAKMVPAGHEPGASWRLDTLAGALGRPGQEWVQRLYAVDGAPGIDPVRALNAAFATDGILLDVVDGARLDLPIHIVSIVDAAQGVAVATRNLVRVGRGARATVIESHIGIDGAAQARQATSVTQLVVGESGEAHHLQHVTGGADAVHLCQWDVQLGGAAVYRGFQLTAGIGLARNETRATFTGPNARFDLSGLMLGRGADHIDTTLVVRHTTTGCESRELFKAVLDDRARAVFQGKVLVEAQAQKTDGKQMANALMLSEDAEFDSKPELEIYADDVACGHGSTAAELDGDMLFYLRSRGIAMAEARALLIESFAAEALDKIEDETVRAATRAVTVGWLGKL